MIIDLPIIRGTSDSDEVWGHWSPGNSTHSQVPGRLSLAADPRSDLVQFHDAVRRVSQKAKRPPCLPRLRGDVPRRAPGGGISRPATGPARTGRPGLSSNPQRRSGSPDHLS